jgi:RNA polymerase sigma-70 factor (ECF subfamily)
MDDESLDRLVAEAQGGDPEAFGRIFDAYSGPIFRFIASRVRSPSDAEDLTQLVFVKALEALPRYEARGVPFGGWLFRLARNAIIDEVRTRRDHLSLVSAVTRETDDAGPEASAALRDDLDRIAQAMSELTDDQREVIELRFFAGLSVLETAVAMGRQEGTVRGLQFRAIAALRRAIGIEADAPTPARSPSSASKVAAATINVLR